jgi:hypothetical protein
MTAQILGDKWEHVRSLGKGSFGTVHLFRDAVSMGLYAVKFIECTELAKEEVVQKEVLNHCQLSHDNIARFKEVILCPPYLAIVMEVRRKYWNVKNGTKRNGTVLSALLSCGQAPLMCASWNNVETGKNEMIDASRILITVGGSEFEAYHSLPLD